MVNFIYMVSITNLYMVSYDIYISQFHLWETQCELLKCTLLSLFHLHEM